MKDLMHECVHVPVLVQAPSFPEPIDYMGPLENSK